MLQVFLLTLVLVGFVVIGLAFNLIFRKKDFPETHVGHNKEMRKRGIVCVKTYDKKEQQLAWKNANLTKLVIDRTI